MIIGKIKNNNKKIALEKIKIIIRKMKQKIKAKVMKMKIIMNII